MKKLTILLGGALVGAAVAALFTPEPGEDLRERIKTLLRKRGIIQPDNVSEFVELIATEIEENKV